ncbi:MAG: hypothetical protein R6W90_07720 [Ignavibacteriaceae bacterium]
MYKIILFFLIIGWLDLASCGNDSSYINTSHLDHLYEEVIVNNDTLGIIHIYAEYPDYHWIDDSDEGTACVDDVARAMIFYLDHYRYSGNETSLIKVKHLLNYLFYMHAENGYFYNFTWKDNSINREFKTSVAEPNWWSWRALWALSEANELFKAEDKYLSQRILHHLNKIIAVTISWLEKEKSYKDYSGFETPAWLPHEAASDQAAIIIKGLVSYYETEKDSAVIPAIKQLAEGIMSMQAGDQNTFPYYSFLSWQNTWHAWGNSQADALLSAGLILNDSSLIHSALNELEYFYPFLLNEKYYSDYSITKQSSKIEIIQLNKFPQIAYSIRPFVFAALQAYDITGNKKYSELAGKIACWFIGDNAASAVMYEPGTGRCYDGIVDEKKINKNSGAESTIECLLSLQKIEQYPAAKAVLEDYRLILAE